MSRNHITLRIYAFPIIFHGSFVMNGVVRELPVKFRALSFVTPGSGLLKMRWMEFT